jgi:hypothetical protein
MFASEHETHPIWKQCTVPNTPRTGRVGELQSKGIIPPFTTIFLTVHSRCVQQGSTLSSMAEAAGGRRKLQYGGAIILGLLGVLFIIVHHFSFNTKAATASIQTSSNPALSAAAQPFTLLPMTPPKPPLPSDIGRDGEENGDNDNQTPKQSMAVTMALVKKAMSDPDGFVNQNGTVQKKEFRPMALSLYRAAILPETANTMNRSETKDSLLEKYSFYEAMLEWTMVPGDAQKTAPQIIHSRGDDLPHTHCTHCTTRTARTAPALITPRLCLLACRHQGYPIEEVEVTSPDGFRLMMHRIPGPTCCPHLPRTLRLVGLLHQRPNRKEPRVSARRCRVRRMAQQL